MKERKKDALVAPSIGIGMDVTKKGPNDGFAEPFLVLTEKMAAAIFFVSSFVSWFLLMSPLLLGSERRIGRGFRRSG